MEKAINAAINTRTALKAKLPFGPNRVGVTSKEAMRFTGQIDSNSTAIMKNRMTPEQWEAILRRLYGG